MPCDIAISTETRDQWREDMAALRREVARTRAARDEAIGRAKEMRLRVQHLEAAMESMKPVPNRLTWFSIGAGSTAALVIIGFLVF